MKPTLALLTILLFCISCIDTTGLSKGICDGIEEDIQGLEGNFIYHDLGLSFPIIKGEEKGIYYMDMDGEKLLLKACRVKDIIYADIGEPGVSNEEGYIISKIVITKEKVNLIPLKLDKKKLEEKNINYEIELGDFGEETLLVTSENIHMYELLSTVLPDDKLLNLEFLRE